MSVKVNALDHLVINVADVARSTEWYRTVLGMEVRVFDPGQGKDAADIAGVRKPKDQCAATRCRQGRLVHRRSRNRRQR